MFLMKKFYRLLCWAGAYKEVAFLLSYFKKFLKSMWSYCVKLEIGKIWKYKRNKYFCIANVFWSLMNQSGNLDRAAKQYDFAGINFCGRQQNLRDHQANSTHKRTNRQIFYPKRTNRQVFYPQKFQIAKFYFHQNDKSPNFLSTKVSTYKLVLTLTQPSTRSHSVPKWTTCTSEGTLSVDASTTPTTAVVTATFVDIWRKIIFFATFCK